MNGKKKIGICVIGIVALVLSTMFFNLPRTNGLGGEVILTFDDSAQGYDDDASAYLMNSYGFRGVAFFEVDCITWQKVSVWKTLVARDWEIGSHTINHAHLNSLSMSQLIYEVNESKNRIEQMFNTKVISFAYPFCEGSLNATVLQVLKDSGYIYARVGEASNWLGRPCLRINCYDFDHDTFKTTVEQLVSASIKYGFAVAMFHRVSNSTLEGWHTLSPSDFEYVLSTIRNAGLNVVTFKDVAATTKHYLEITGMVTSKSVVGQGYNLLINTTIMNYGVYTEIFNVTSHVNTTLIASQTIMLASGDFTTSTFTWNTTGFTKGNWTISAYAEPVLNETYIADNNVTWTVHVGVPGDISGPTQGVYDGTCNMRDVAYMIMLFDTRSNSSNWNPNADVNDDGVCNMRDIQIAILNFTSARYFSPLVL